MEKLTLTIGLMVSLAVIAKAENVTSIIADCIVIDSPEKESIGDTLKVFDQQDGTLLAEVQSPNSDLLSIPTKHFNFSKDGTVLFIRIGNYTYVTINRGVDTEGTMSVMLGSGPSTLKCTTYWK